MAIFRRLRADLQTKVESWVVCLRLFYIRHHPAVCCSLVRHRAEIWERDQKPRQRRHLSRFATVTVLAFAGLLNALLRAARCLPNL